MSPFIFTTRLYFVLLEKISFMLLFTLLSWIYMHLFLYVQYPVETHEKHGNTLKKLESIYDIYFMKLKIICIMCGTYLYFSNEGMICFSSFSFKVSWIKFFFPCANLHLWPNLQCGWFKHNSVLLKKLVLVSNSWVFNLDIVLLLLIFNDINMKPAKGKRMNKKIWNLLEYF